MNGLERPIAACVIFPRAIWLDSTLFRKKEAITDVDIFSAVVELAVLRGIDGALLSMGGGRGKWTAAVSQRSVVPTRWPASFQAPAMYWASVLGRAMVPCFLECHEIVPPMCEHSHGPISFIIIFRQSSRIGPSATLVAALRHSRMGLHHIQLPVFYP